jgi:hypothetical protein
MSKHTPGDWYVSHNELTSDSLPGRNTIATMAVWLPHAEEEQRANARLMAAAPDLLEALNAIIAVDEKSPLVIMHPSVRTQLIVALDDARKAIAKAEGQ